MQLFLYAYSICIILARVPFKDSRAFDLLFLFLVFVFCRHTPANVALLLIYFQNFFNGRVHLRTYDGKLFGYVFMYSRFRNSELFSSGTNSSFMFENIATENYGAFLDILTCFYFQYAHSNTQYFYLCIC